MTVRAQERYIRNVVVGVENDHLVERVTFAGLPTIGEAQLVTLHWVLTGEATVGDIVTLNATEDGYAWNVTNTITQYGGRRIEAYVRITADGLVWSSKSFVVIVAALPDADGVASFTPTIIDEMLAAIAQHNEDMAAALAKVGVISVSAETLDTGAEATVVHTATDGGVALAFGIPRGDPGEVSAAQLAEAIDPIAADAAAGGPALALLETITVGAGGVSAIERTQTPGGAAFRLLAVKIDLETAAADAAGNIGITLYDGYDVIQYVYVGNAINTAARYCTVDMRPLNGLWRGRTTSPAVNSTIPNTSLTTISDSVATADHPMGDRLRLYTASTIPEGSIIKIWGVQADA